MLTQNSPHRNESILNEADAGGSEQPTDVWTDSISLLPKWEGEADWFTLSTTGNNLLNNPFSISLHQIVSNSSIHFQSRLLLHKGCQGAGDHPSCVD